MCGTLLVEDMHVSVLVEQALHDSDGVGLVARATSRYFCRNDAMMSLVVLSARCMVLLKIYKLQIILLIKSARVGLTGF